MPVRANIVAPSCFAISNSACIAVCHSSASCSALGFARDLHLKDGLPLADAAIEAARLRLRPIVMTSLAFILGLLPLVLASGAGANAQKSIGFATLTGMIGSTLLTVAVVSSLFCGVAADRGEADFAKGPIPGVAADE
jgi:HAE1 family hydrophobic/amphiphilic exporter-1